MDPNATVLAFVHATLDGDLDAAAAAADDYAAWRRAGGFPATLEITSGTARVIELDVEQDRIGVTFTALADPPVIEKWISATLFTDYSRQDLREAFGS